MLSTVTQVTMSSSASFPEDRVQIISPKALSTKIQQWSAEGVQVDGRVSQIDSETSGQVHFMEWILKKQLLADVWKFQLKQKFLGMDQCYLIKATENARLGRAGAVRDPC